MCDYSLQHVASRPAKVGDELVSTKFHNSITRGFAAGEDPNVAVCLLPGTELAFESDVEYDPALGSFLPNRKVGEKLARFRKVNNDQHGEAGCSGRGLIGRVPASSRIQKSHSARRGLF